MSCPNCGRENKDTDNFCERCGTKLRDAPIARGNINQSPVYNQTLEQTGQGPLVQQPGFPPYLQTHVPAQAYLQYAGFWRRFLAFLIDGIILATVDYFLGRAMGLDPTDFHQDRTAYDALTTLIHWLYFAGMESSSLSATLGKLALGITVGDLNGNRISFLRATGRHFAKIISGLLCFIGYIMAGFTAKKQALHDMIAGCLVLH